MNYLTEILYWVLFYNIKKDQIRVQEKKVKIQVQKNKEIIDK